MLVNFITLNNCQACLYMTCVYCLIVLEMCEKVPSFSSVLLLRLISTLQLFKFRELHSILKISAWLSIFLKREWIFFSHQIAKGLNTGCLNERKAVGMGIQQIHFWTQPSVCAEDWMPSLSLPLQPLSLPSKPWQLFSYCSQVCKAGSSIAEEREVTGCFVLLIKRTAFSTSVIALPSFTCSILYCST